MTLASKVTIIRILLMPIFLFFLSQKNLSLWAGLIFLILAFSDVFDGLIARAKKQESLLGMLLDPLADKLLLSSTFLILAITKHAPFWLFFIVGGRDILMIFGGGLIYFLVGSNFIIHARFLGKSATVIQSLTIFVVLFSLPGENYLFYLTALVTLLSGIDYLLVFSQKIIYAQ